MSGWKPMNLTSFLANKCFELLLNCDAGQENGNPCTRLHPSKPSRPVHTFIPPPWARAQKLFRSLCNGCGDCLGVCDNKILIPGRNNYPQVDFRKGHCSFCGACAKSCTRGALVYDQAAPPWHLQAVIAAGCLMKNRVLCSTCAEQCDRRAIVLPKTFTAGEGPRILAEKCNGCGACFCACPVGAVAFGYNGQQEKP